MEKIITPFIRKMRTQGGTLYTMSSAVEDIGLNINERNNVIKISNFALLNIPSAKNSEDKEINHFNTPYINGNFKYIVESDEVIKDAGVLIAESFQNYALNLEANLMHQDTYNVALSSTVSERVFWKWLKETGAIRWVKDSSSGYFCEENYSWQNTESKYNSVVKCIGNITAGNIRKNNYNTYEETYVIVPTSFGQNITYFKQNKDTNYFPGQIVTQQIGPNILGHNGPEGNSQIQPSGLDFRAYFDCPEANTFTAGNYNLQYFNTQTNTFVEGWWYSNEGLTPSSNSYVIDADTNDLNTTLKYSGDNNSYEFLRSNIDCLEIEFDYLKLKQFFPDINNLDDIAIQSNYYDNSDFEFNTVLIYYQVLDNAGINVLATNLLGVLFLDSPITNNVSLGQDGIAIDFKLPSIIKKQSKSSEGFGNSYSFRINVRSNSIADDTSLEINDDSTTSQVVVEDFTSIFSKLNACVKILMNQNETIQYINEQYKKINYNQSVEYNKILDLDRKINTYLSVDASYFGGIDDKIAKASGLTSYYNYDKNRALREGNYIKTYNGSSLFDDILILDKVLTTKADLDTSTNKIPSNLLPLATKDEYGVIKIGYGLKYNDISGALDVEAASDFVNSFLNDNETSKTTTWSSFKIDQYVTEKIPTTTSILDTKLEGLIINPNTPINDKDSILTAFGKLQRQISSFDISSGNILSTKLTGFVAGSNTVISSDDTILNAFSNTQGQINEINNAITNINVDNIPTVTNTTALDTSKQYAFKPAADGTIKNGSFVEVTSGDKLLPATESQIGGLMLNGNKLSLDPSSGQITNIVSDQIKDSNSNKAQSFWYGSESEYQYLKSSGSIDENTTYYTTDSSTSGPAATAAESIINNNTKIGEVVNIKVWLGTVEDYQTLVSDGSINSEMLYLTY